MKRKAQIWIVVGLALIVGATRLWADFSDPTYPKSIATIVLANGKQVKFAIEVATSREQMEHGLMYRRDLADDAGMLFIFPQPQVINMWMKNTYLALDMLFIGTDGKITRIAADAVPESTDIISSGEAAKAILEVNAGTAARLGIHPGDKILSKDLAGDLR